MNNTDNPIEKTDAQIAEEITEALSSEETQATAEENATTAAENEGSAAEENEGCAAEQPAGIDLDALARVLCEAEERGYQRAVAEREQAVKATQLRMFGMPASDPTPPSTTPTILAGLKPGFWEK